MKKIVILFMLLSVAFSACGQLNFNAKRIAQDTIRARSTSQGGSTGRLELPYEYSGLFPSIAVNDTLLHEWIQKNGGGGVDLVGGSGIIIIADSINAGGNTYDGIDYQMLGGSDNLFKVENEGNSMQLGGEDDGFQIVVGGGVSVENNIDLLYTSGKGDINMKSSTTSTTGGDININKSAGAGDITISNTSTNAGSVIDIIQDGSRLRLQQESDASINGFEIIKGGSNDNPFFISDERPTPRGIEYNGTYEANFSDSSLVTKLYVDSQVGGTNFWKTDVNFSVDAGVIATYDDLEFNGTNSLLFTNTTGGIQFINTGASGIVLRNEDATQGFIIEQDGAGVGSLTLQKVGGSGDLNILNQSSSTGDIFISVGGLAGDMIVQDVSSTIRGLEYDGDYTATFVERSLVDRGYVNSLFSGSLTDGTPTDAEIDAILGTPAVRGIGYKTVIKDSDGTGLMYAVYTDGTGWYWNITTLAL